MNSKQTKRALLGSLTSLLLCFAMLIGSTFAWFTDTASTSVNTIQAGTLDVQLLDESNNSLEGTTLKWQKAAEGAQQEVLWEPGCTYKLQPITIKNNGNLALKYKVAITGINGSAKLNEVIDWTISNNGTLLAGSSDEYTLSAGASNTLTISGTMQTTAGNEYQGEKIEGIAITVLATQDTVEYDSEKNTYDETAAYPAAEVTAMSGLPTNATTNKYIVLTENVTGTGAVAGVYDTTAAFVLNGGTLDGNGKTVTLSNTSYGVQTSGGTIKNMTIKGAGRGIMLNSATEDVYIDGMKLIGCGYGISTAELSTAAKKLIVTNSTINGWSSWAGGLESASFTNCSFGESTYFEGNTSYKFYKHFLRPYVTTTFTDCDFTGGYYLDLSRMLDNNGTATGTVTLENCSINGVKLTKDNFASYMKILIDKQDTEATSTTLPSFVTFK